MIVLKTIVLVLVLIFIGAQLGGVGLALLAAGVVLVAILSPALALHSKPEHASEDGNDDEDHWDMDDPRVPDALRRHAERFRKPVASVVPLGGGEYLLFHADGRLADAVVVPDD